MNILKVVVLDGEDCGGDCESSNISVDKFTDETIAVVRKLYPAATFKLIDNLYEKPENLLRLHGIYPDTVIVNTTGFFGDKLRELKEYFKNNITVAPKYIIVGLTDTVGSMSDIIEPMMTYKGTRVFSADTIGNELLELDEYGNFMYNIEMAMLETPDEFH